MPAYDNTLFTPPAPLATVTLRHPRSGKEVADVPMLLDSGADVTLIPELVAAHFADCLEAGQGYELVGFDGHRNFAQAARLHMLFLGRLFKGRFLLVPQPWGVLGRNVLNQLVLVLDGPRLQWRLEKADS